MLLALVTVARFRPIAAVKRERYCYHMADNHTFNKLVEEALEQAFSGWDFSWVKDRLTESETSWSYRNLVEDRLSHAEAVVDLCTGGGEFLANLGKLPKITYATEGYDPNVAVARKRLEPMGVQVVRFESDDELPLPSNVFDLVINRHGAYSPKELLRISTTGACFLTQQVGSDNASGLNQALNAPPPEHRTWCLDEAVEQLTSLGLQIKKAEEERPTIHFSDVGAVVFYLKAIPWQVVNFDVSHYHDELLDIHHIIESTGSFDVNAHRFLVEATVP